VTHWQNSVMRRSLALALTLLAGCGGGAELAQQLQRAVPATTAPATTAPATTAVPTTAVSTTEGRTTTRPKPQPTTTTSAPTTTLPPLPVPAAPPPEDGSTDPRIQLGSIEVPRLGIDRPMFEGIRLSTLDLGPGHWPGTALPGQLGNVVVAGHRVSHNQDFHDLDQLVAGDKVIFHTGSGPHVYRVVSTEIVDPDALWIVGQSYTRTATLFACHPPGSVSQRIVVHLAMAKRRA
jgi:sortase A